MTFRRPSTQKCALRRLTSRRKKNLARDSSEFSFFFSDIEVYHIARILTAENKSLDHKVLKKCKTFRKNSNLAEYPMFTQKFTVESARFM